MKTVPLSLRIRGESRQLDVPPGQTLREALLEADCTPYTGVFRRLNCGGMGLCGSCQVKVFEDGQWWQRRSCQIRCFQPLQIEIE